MTYSSNIKYDKQAQIKIVNKKKLMLPIGIYIILFFSQSGAGWALINTPSCQFLIKTTIQILTNLLLMIYLL